jgi:hypothetical protein
VAVVAVVAVVADWLALAVVWIALLAPNEPDRLTPMAFLRLPVEGIVLVLLALALTRRRTRAGAVAVTVAVGVPLGVASVLKVLGLGFHSALGRPFTVVNDTAHLRSALGFVSASFGPVAAAAATAGAVVVAAVLLVGIPASVGRLARLVQRRRRASLVTVTVLAVLWAAGAVSGVRVEPHGPLAAAEAARFAVSEVRGSAAALRRQHAFDRAVAADAFQHPATGDLVGLRGKDVVVVFVESYGRVAVEGPASAQVQAVLDAGSTRLEASGFASRSAFLTSPTFGGVSWLAHATLQSGVWVDTQWSYDHLLSSDRTSLSRAFGRAGWRTVAVLPSNRGAWPEGQAHYGFDTIYDGSDLGYTGPRFGFSSMPDQYALHAFQRLEMSHRERAPVMAQVDLASSHGPWAPLPTMLDWDELGDGSRFDQIHEQAEPAATLWSHRHRVPAAYMTSIEYTLTALISYVERYGDDDLVVVLVGDHQPATIVSGFGGNRDVPVTVIARDREVLERISAWSWQEGLRPDASAPVWRMDTFRDRFMAAYSGRAGGASPTATGAVAPPGTGRP